MAIKKVAPKSKNYEVLSGKTREMSIKVPIEGTVAIGMTKGVTINMGDYESARIDVMITRNVNDSDADIVAGIKDISTLLSDCLSDEISELTSK